MCRRVLLHALSRVFLALKDGDGLMSTAITGSATFDKGAYAQGDTMTLTVVRSGTTDQQDMLTEKVTLTAPDGSTQTLDAGPVPVDVKVSVKVAVAVSDPAARQWALQSDDGTTAVFTATA